MERTKRVGQLEEDLEADARKITADFAGLTGGTRYICLLHRQKDGGATNEPKRRGGYYITHSEEEFYNALVRLLTLKIVASKPYRLYASVNPRNMLKAEKQFKMDMLTSDFAGGDNHELFWKHLGGKWRAALMAPGSRQSSLFLIDCDGEGDVTAPALIWLANHDVQILKQYATPNGWHIITEPFNPNDFKIPNCEIKKDALMLLAG